MTVKNIFKIIVIFLLVFVIGFILHTNIFGRLKLGMVAPNILIIITAAFGYMNGSMSGMLMGFLCGLMVDSYNSSLFGLNCLIFLLIGYVNGIFSKFFYGDDVRMPMFLVFFSDVIYGVIIYCLTFLARGKTEVLFYLLNIIIPEAVYTMIVSLLLYFPLLKSVKLMRSKINRETNIG